MILKKERLCLVLQAKRYQTFQSKEASQIDHLKLNQSMIIIYLYKQVNSQQFLMSTKVKAPRRSTYFLTQERQKKFIQQDEQNEIGVMDEGVQLRNKIQQKQEGMFDPHQLRQNMFQFQFQSKTYDNQLLDFQVQFKPQKKQFNQSIPLKSQQKIQKIQKTTTISSSVNDRKKRQKRDKKKLIDSQEQNVFQQPNQENNNQEKENQTGQFNKNEEKAQQQEGEQDISQILNKKNKKENINSTQTFVLMHHLVSKNKEMPKKAIYKPLQSGEVSFVYFKRHVSGFSQYYQVIGEDQRPILFCENQRGCIGCNYYISMTKEMNKNSDSYLGKLRGNASGSIYQLYDYGSQPKSKDVNQAYRSNMAYIEYQDNFLGMKGPRKLKAVIPKVKSYTDYNRYRLGQDQTLTQLKPSQIIRCRNKQPRWNERLKSYALNFGGRVKQASIKNFILMDDSINVNMEQKAPNMIIFGKINQSTFALQFRYPLSLYQAFGIAMSQFDYKLNCE